ncbi:hypothetical protein LB505_005007 [Fusarium chuoi]|nr:hypothetical protein LB505_005007 [Fusarium chuoi]
MKGGGLLIPPWFEYHEPSCSDWAIVSIAFGMTLCLAIFGLIRVGIQTYHQWKRAQRITTYMVLIWLELVSSAIIGGLGWGYSFVFGYRLDCRLARRISTSTTFGTESRKGFLRLLILL